MDKEIERTEGYSESASISSIFEWAESEIVNINGRLKKENAAKKKVITELAEKLSGKMPEENISTEIKDRLAHLVSARYIDECLEPKYKQRYRVDNARKRRRRPNLAEEALLSPEKAMIELGVSSSGPSAQILSVIPRGTSEGGSWENHEEDGENGVTQEKITRPTTAYDLIKRVVKDHKFTKVLRSLRSCDKECYLQFDENGILQEIESDAERHERVIST